MLEQPTIDHITPDDVGKLFFRDLPMYKRIAFSYVQDWQVAEDMVSDSFIRLWEHKEDLSPATGNIRQYIITIVKNACLQHLRQQNVHSKVENNIFKSVSWELQSSINSLENSEPMNNLFSNDVQQIIRRELDKMPELTRNIFICSRMKAMTHKDIAEEYDIPVRKVIWEIQQALGILRVSLKDYLPAIIAAMAYTRL